MTATKQQLANREKWRAALLSDDYKQTQETLRQVDPRTGEVLGYCCIGVALDVLGNGAWDDTSYIEGDSAEPDYVEHNGDMAGHTFVSLFGHMGLDTSSVPDGTSDDVREECVFIQANDAEGKTFAQIADMIPKEGA